MYILVDALIRFEIASFFSHLLQVLCEPTRKIDKINMNKKITYINNSNHADEMDYNKGFNII